MDYQFKDALRELIERRSRLSPENFQEIANQIRRYRPDFTGRYLGLLLNGHPPTYDDRLAISQALEPASGRWMSEFWALEDRISRRLAISALRFTKSPHEAKHFVDWCDASASFQHAEIGEEDISLLFAQYRLNRRLDHELELFSLPVSGPYEG